MSVTRSAIAVEETAQELADAKREAARALPSRRSEALERVEALRLELGAAADAHAYAQARELAGLIDSPPAPRRLCEPVFGALMGRRGSDVSSPVAPRNRRS